ncbi:MAG: hypothetical protein JNK74_07350 [Candidatus Hydrogenedentes bacterium]|nr:hypothetical protein [Candidatus Hydrogenedentota bacterium]
MMPYDETPEDKAQALIFALLLLICTMASAVAYFTVSEILQHTIPVMAELGRVTSLLTLLYFQMAASSAALSRLHNSFYPLYKHRPAIVLAAFMMGMLHLAIVDTGERGVDLTGLLADYTRFVVELSEQRTSVSELPSEAFGLLALFTSGLIASTGYRYWRIQRTSGVWRGVQALVYPAYASAWIWFALGAYQYDSNPVYETLLIAGPVSFAITLIVAQAFSQKADSVPPTSAIPSALNNRNSCWASIRRDGLPAVPAGTAATMIVFVAITGALASAPPMVKTAFSDVYSRTVLRGIYTSRPFPSIYLSPDWNENPSLGQYVLLCGTGHQGVPSNWRQFDDLHVSVEGRIRYRGTTAMLEMEVSTPPLPIGDTTTVAVTAPQAIGGTVNFSGELLSTKCYLGAHWSSSGQSRRRCAIASLKGGVPLGVLTGSNMEGRIILLAGPAGSTLEIDETVAGRIVDVEGTISSRPGYYYVEVISLKLHGAE